MEQSTPTINRILFGIITLIFIASTLKVIYAYSLGSDTPPFPFWIVFYGIPMFGFILITFRGDVRFRLHKIWTPIGLAMLILTWYYIIFVDFQNGILNTLLLNTSESVIYVTSLGLMLAFVDMKVLYEYAYFLAPTLIFSIIGVWHDDGYLLTNFANSNFTFESDGLIDQFWFASGILFAYYAVKKFRAERPPIRRTLLLIGIAAGIVTLLIVMGQVAAQFLPTNSWVANWLSAQKPPIDLTCIGSGCSLPLYANVYSTDSNLCLQGNSNFRAGIEPFSIVAQDHGLLLCKFVMDTDASTLTVSCPHEIASTGMNTLNFTMLQCNFAESGSTK